MTNKHRVHYNSALSRDKQLVCKGMACWMHCTTGSPNGDTASRITKTLWILHCDFQELAFCILKCWLQTRFAHIYMWAKICHKHIIPKLNESEEEDVKKWSRDRTKCAETNFRLSSPTSPTSPTCKTAPPCALIVGSVSYVSSARMPKHAKDRLPIRAQL